MYIRKENAGIAAIRQLKRLNEILKKKKKSGGTKARHGRAIKTVGILVRNQSSSMLEV